MQSNKFDPKMLEILICPVTQSGLSLNHETQELISQSAGLAFPIRSGVPIMLTSEARPLELIERAKAKITRR